MKSRMGDRERSREKEDIWLYRAVVVVLGLTLLASMIGAIALTMMGQSTPEVLVTLGSASLTGLAGLLAPSPLDR